MRQWTWLAVGVVLGAGDHGSELERVLRVHADEKGLHATSELSACTGTGRGALDSSEVL